MDHWTDLLVVGVWGFVTFWQMLYFSPSRYPDSRDLLMIFGPCLLSGALLLYTVYPARLRYQIATVIAEYGHTGTLAGFETYVMNGMKSCDKHAPVGE